MSIFKFFKRKENKDLEAKRREYLGKFGRITEGSVIESEATEEGELIRYVYSVHGANYESCEFLSMERVSDPIKYAPGAKVGIRYDPRQHANSILE